MNKKGLAYPLLFVVTLVICGVVIYNTYGKLGNSYYELELKHRQFQENLFLDLTIKNKAKFPLENTQIILSTNSDKFSFNNIQKELKTISVGGEEHIKFALQLKEVYVSGEVIKVEVFSKNVPFLSVPYKIK